MIYNIKIVILGIIVLFLEFLNLLQSGFTGIILGNRKNNNKILFSVIYGFITYVITQIITLIFIFIIALFNSDIMNVFTSNVVDISILKTMIIIAIFIYSSIIIFNLFINIKLLNKGVDVD